MNIQVCVREIVDPEARLRLDGRSIPLDTVTRLLDPVDAAAVEVAVQLVDEHGGEVVVVTAATVGAEAALRTAIAQGATRAVRIDGPEPPTGLAAGAMLAEAASAERPPDLILCGAASSDFGGGSAGAGLAARAGLPIVQNVVAIDGVEDGHMTVQRRCDGGVRELVRVRMPAVLTVDQSIAQPRFPTTRARLAAQRAVIEVVEPPPDAAAANAPKQLGYQTLPPRMHGIAWPDEQLNGRDRLRFLVQGGEVRAAGTGGPVTGEPDELASVIEAFLRERGFVNGA